MEKLYNFKEFKIFEESDTLSQLTSSLSSSATMTMLNNVFNGLDVEDIVVNGAQIISIIVSFFGKFGMRISLTIETLLLIYWIWKYQTAKSVDVKRDAMIQLIFAAFGFAVLGAGPTYKAISNTFAKGFKEYKATGEVSKLAHLDVLKKNEKVLKTAATELEKTVADNINKVPKQLINDATKKEIKASSKEVKQYIDDVLEKEAKVKKPNVKEKKFSKIKKTGKLIKLGKKLLPIASYLLNRYLQKKKNPEHAEEVENDFAILQYSVNGEKIIGAKFPKDLDIKENKRLEQNGKVTPCLIGLKILIEDFDNKDVINNYNIISDTDPNYQYFLMVATNGTPIYNNFMLFAISPSGKILVSKLEKNAISFVSTDDLMKGLKVKLISNEDLDPISSYNFDTVLKEYRNNVKLTNSYAMWNKIIGKTFTRKWWDKNFKLKESK